MGNFTVSEMLTIGVIILIVFGPNRLPELARRAGQFLAIARKAIQSLRDEIDTDYEEIAGPVRDVRNELRQVRRELDKSVSELSGQIREIGQDIEHDVRALEAAEEEPHTGEAPALPASTEQIDSGIEDEAAPDSAGTATEALRPDSAPPETSAERIRTEFMRGRPPGVVGNGQIQPPDDPVDASSDVDPPLEREPNTEPEGV